MAENNGSIKSPHMKHLTGEEKKEVLELAGQMVAETGGLYWASRHCGISQGHFYNLINERSPMTRRMADRICEAAEKSAEAVE